MSEQDPMNRRTVPQVNPVAPPAPADAQGQAPTPAPARRSRAGLWWAIGIVAAVGLLLASCVLPFMLLVGAGGSKAKRSSMGLSGAESIAVIHIDGVIAGTGDTYSGYITPEYFYDQLDRAQDDEKVKAVVLRVDSPGGTVAASQEIARYVEACEKPVIVSTGDVNASGAYMISSQADEIWALPGSAVGSIGVISQIPNASELLEKIGVEFQVITAGENKDTGSAFRPLTKEERALIQGQIDEVYEQFIDIVAAGRDMERAEVEKLATGWTWSGEKAKELGLVDEIGTHQDALNAAALAGGIKGDYDVITYEEDSFDALFRSLIGLQSLLGRFAGADMLAPGSSIRETLPR